jgi:hypothetical protein
VIGGCDSVGMTITSIEHLQNQIEQLVREYVAACRKAAASAVDRAFTSPTPRRSASVPRTGTRKTAERRRGPDELAALSERLYEAVCASPGASMTALAARVGATARDLNRPALLLKRAGRVRSAGQRQGTRYFPMAAKTSGNT